MRQIWVSGPHMPSLVEPYKKNQQFNFHCKLCFCCIILFLMRSIIVDFLLNNEHLFIITVWLLKKCLFIKWTKNLLAPAWWLFKTSKFCLTQWKHKNLPNSTWLAAKSLIPDPCPPLFRSVGPAFISQQVHQHSFPCKYEAPSAPCLLTLTHRLFTGWVNTEHRVYRVAKKVKELELVGAVFQPKWN